MFSIIYIISRFKASFWLPKDGALYPHIKGKIWIQKEIIKGCPKMWWHKEVDVDFFSSFDFRIRLTPQRETTLTKCWFVYPHVYSFQWLLPDVKTPGISKVWKLPSPKTVQTMGPSNIMIFHVVSNSEQEFFK